ncbi:MAG: hypothetical protein ACI4M9_06510 [Succinivibrio sp.]
MTRHEEMLLDELEKIASTVELLTKRLSAAEDSLIAKDKEANRIREDMSRLKEENQHLKEVIQTMKDRLDAVLGNLPEVPLS